MPDDSAKPAQTTTPPAVTALVERFGEHADAYHAGRYNETQIRREFIDPLFRALGWDVDNSQGYAEAYKDVIHEDAIKIGGATKAPDYCFRIGGVRKFFVEAKKPAVDIKADPGPAFQLRRYAWSAKLPLSILTDFEELAVYDCRVRPVKTDKPSKARTLYFRYGELPGRWGELAAIFSREAILKGSFDKYVESSRRKRGTAEVDDAFLAEIEQWRDTLARNLALRNGGLTQRDLNFAVQRTIDRIVFLRICEDRAIEPYGTLLALTNGEKVYDRLFERFRRADERYNSGLFHFETEKGRPEAPDDLTPSLTVDDKPLKDILARLYYPESPYEFSVLPADILGQVYEQFLGKVIRLTKGHRAVVEAKPEVRKAGGVYYTPTYIVDYIVQHTVGKLVEGRTPRQVGALTAGYRPSKAKGARPLTVLDPACGSGSFLLGAYQYLLDWYRDRYLEDGPAAHAAGNSPRLFQHPAGDWRLTTAERKRILLAHIHGVDIDSQAVETTKLSLLLKVLEGESDETIGASLRLFHERALPDLAANVKCGNSLIGPDFYHGRQMAMFDEEQRLRINAFDWNAEFPHIMQSGGFDAVIGNPPYGAALGSEEHAYLRYCYSAHSSGLDSYVLFMECALRLCGPEGYVSFIVPTGWHTGADFSSIRRHVACASDPVGFVNLPYDVFRAWVDTTVFVVRKRSVATAWPRREECKVVLKTFSKRHRIADAFEMSEGTDEVGLTSWFINGEDQYLTFADEAATAIIRKIEKVGRPFCAFADIQRGVTPLKTTPEATHPSSRLAFKGTVRRYKFDRGPNVYVRFDETLAEPKPERYFQGPRLLLRELISRQFQLQAVKVVDDFVTNKSMQSILPTPDGPALEYLLAVLNSKLMSWYFLRKSSVAQRDDFPKIVLRETRSLPIPEPHTGGRVGSAHHGRLVFLGDAMLDLHKQLAAAKTPHGRTAIQRQIDATDRRIDELVYELYGLRDEEIAIVEAGI